MEFLSRYLTSTFALASNIYNSLHKYCFFFPLKACTIFITIFFAVEKHKEIVFVYICNLRLWRGGSID